MMMISVMLWCSSSSPSTPQTRWSLGHHRWFCNQFSTFFPVTSPHDIIAMVLIHRMTLLFYTMLCYCVASFCHVIALYHCVMTLCNAIVRCHCSMVLCHWVTLLRHATESNKIVVKFHCGMSLFFSLCYVFLAGYSNFAGTTSLPPPP